MKNTKPRIGIYWFRKCLRLHDNPMLLKASTECECLYPIFILDPWFKENANVGANRWRFLWESLKDLDTSLRKLNSRIIFIESTPREVFENTINEWNITDVYYEDDTEPYSKERDTEVNKILKNKGIDTHTCYSHTLYDPHYLFKLAGNKIVTTYSSFLTLLNKAGGPSTPLDSLTVKLNTITLNPDHFNIPELNKICKAVDTLDPVIYPGGESEGLSRMEKRFKDKEWVCSFSKPNTNPFSLIPSTTVLSPYLKFGCLSVRLLYRKVKEAYQHKSHTTPPESLEGQLLWREFFYFVGAFTKDFDKMKGNNLCRQIDWSDNEKYLDAWANGRTGYPLIDSIMIQLRNEGWIHHLSRHAVACFLTRGDLYCSWEKGMKVFEELLLDADWSLNAANWQWLSASTFFSQYWRVYSPISFGKKYDKTGEYIRKYLPVLKNFPSKFIYEPWKASLDAQSKAGVIIGQDYPFPIVDHSKVSAENKEKIKKHFHSNS